MGASVEVSVVLPAYNEEATLAETVRVTLEHLDSFLPAGSYEVIVAEDGCDDRTPEIADELAAEHEAVRHLHSDERLGRGGALEFAFRQARGGTLVYFDTDLATDMAHLEELVESVRSGEADVATGSRLLAGSDADRPAKRGVPSRGYNALVRLLLGSEVRDHQCGFKAFDRAALEALLADVEDEHWWSRSSDPRNARTSALNPQLGTPRLAGRSASLPDIHREPVATSYPSVRTLSTSSSR